MMKKLIKKIFILSLIAISNITNIEANTKDDQLFIDSLLENNDQIRHNKTYKLPELSEEQNNEIFKEKDWINQLKKQERNNSRQNDSSAFYFLSFSIQEDDLKTMITDAFNYQIPVLIRGMVNDNMNDTIKATFNVVKDTNKGGINIDPTKFEEFNIEKVPALVLTCDQGYDVIYGNASLDWMLRKIYNEGDCKIKAKQLIEGSIYG